MPRKSFSDLSKRRQKDILKVVEINAEAISNETRSNLQCQVTPHRSEDDVRSVGPSTTPLRQTCAEMEVDSAESVSATSESERESDIEDSDDTEDSDDYSERLDSSSNSQHTLGGMTSESEDEMDPENLDNAGQVDGHQELADDPPLYDGASISVRESMLMLLSLLLKHNVEQTCLSDIIDLLNLHCGQANLKKNSLYKFKKYFNLPELSQYQKHYYCSECCHELERQDSICENCEENTKISHFIELPFLDQLKEMYKRRGFYESLQHRFNRDVPQDTVSDVYDGQLYKNVTELGFTSNHHNITLSWYTDGIPVFKSSKVAMTPVYLSINELPFSDRIKRENTLLAGLLFGSKKVGVNNLLKELSTQFETLAGGIDVLLPQGQTINVRGLLLLGTCDLPAKSDVLNLMQYNGAFGCPDCEWPGETYRLPTGGTTHVYRYTADLPLRTTQDAIQHAKEALQTGKPVLGWKGPCMISKYMPDFIGGTAIDRLHAVDGGVIQKLLKLWFGPSHRNSPFSLLDVKDIINARLKAMKPPKFVHRMPRSVEELCHWKASELKMWAFYYSLPILQGIMRADYFENYSLLITAISILSSDSVTKNMIDVAENLLHQFVRGFEKLYGLQFCSINIHQLLHLAECVRQLGPLWGYSCYPYEDLNGRLLKTVHGTRHIDSQVATSHTQFITMRRHLDHLEEGRVKDYCFRRKKQVKICEKMSAGCYSVGTYSKILPELPAQIQEAMNRSRIPLGRVQTYKRLLKESKLIVSETYLRDSKTQSSHVQYLHHDEKRIGSIYCFIKVTPDCQCLHECQCQAMHYAITRTLRSDRVFGVNTEIDDGQYIQLPHLLKTHRQDELIALPLPQIISVCVHMTVDDASFIGLLINSHELE